MANPLLHNVLNPYPSANAALKALVPDDAERIHVWKWIVAQHPAKAAEIRRRLKLGIAVVCRNVETGLFSYKQPHCHN